MTGRQKLNPTDLGELKFEVIHEDGVVYIQFPKLIKWFAMPFEEAREFAKDVLRHTGVPI